MSEWIKWDGGECPVANDVWVEVKFHDCINWSGISQHLGWMTSNAPPMTGDITHYRVIEEPAAPDSPLDTQVGGDHYKSCSIQPVQYIEANDLRFLEGCVVKRITRHDKPTGKGREDIEKIIHECQLIIELRYG